MVIDEKCHNNITNSNSNGNGVNGFLHGSSSASDATASGSGGDGTSLRTYKRRKFAAGSNHKMIKDLVDLGLQKKSCEQVCDPKINCHSLLNGSDDCSYQHWRNVLESICQSLSSPEGGSGGIQDCIRDALNNPRTSHKLAKEISNHHNGQSHLHRTSNGCSSAADGLSAVTSNGSSNESGHSTVSRLCERALFRLLVSRKFASLCKLFSENFDGLKIERLFDFSLINSRVKEGVYEHTPLLFSTDIQQIWRRLNSIGNEMVSLSNNLSELSRTFCSELGGSTELDTSSHRKHEDCGLQIKQEVADASIFCTCRQCGERSDVRECLVCDLCEAMFHVSCIEPAVKEIPKSWYCADCSSSGVGSHEDCVVCERLNADSGIHGGVDTVLSFEETLDEFEESSDGIIETGPQVFRGSKRLPCKICGDNLIDGEEFRVCEHRFCQYKYYHIRCLSSKELKSYGPHWYCPSCLCRACLTDKDDDDLVMCDGCDHGYHIYCMTPPRTSIPKGKWFCPKCDAGIKAIRKAKKVIEDLERNHKKSEGTELPDSTSEKGKQDFEEAGGGSGGMDMLLTAAKTLNDEEFDVPDGES